MTRTLAIGLGLAAACCTTSSTKGPDSDRRGGDSLSATASDSGAASTSPNTKPASAGGKKPMATAPASRVTLVFVSQTRTRPPSSTLMFDVTVENPRDTARWFLLPAIVDASTATMDSTISGVSVKLLKGSGRVALADFTGLPGFKSLKVPPRGHIKIRGYQMRAASSPPAGARDFAVIVCDSMTVGGEPVKAWFKTAPLSDAKADVTLDGATLAGTRDSPGYEAVPVVVTGHVERLTVQVQLPAGL